MTDREIELIIGALLHDIGKVVYRTGTDQRKHSRSGYDYLVENTNLKSREVLDCVRYHHADTLKDAKISQDSLAYIVYLADNVSAALDRREAEEKEEGFDLHTPLQPVFNILNGNKGNSYYSPYLLNPEAEINYPTQEKKVFSESQYRQIEENIRNCLNGLEWNDDYINSLLEVLEGNLSYIPSSTSKRELPDISLFDHVKMTAAVASCIYHYLEEKGISNYKEVLWKQGKEFYSEEAFLLASMDVSGIQKFIYTITTENAVRMLRARSFYLEIMMEHIIDLLLEKVGLSRSNLIYSGGGHCYLLLPNTENVKLTFRKFIQDVNEWFLENFQTQLYIAGAVVPCSSRSLQNEPEGSYERLFRDLSGELSVSKRRRYSAQQITLLNQKKYGSYTRECRICRSLDRLKDTDICSMCDSLRKFSANVLYSDFFSVTSDRESGGLPLPGNYFLLADSEESLKKRMNSSPYYVRSYGKNKMFSGKSIATRLWVGNYTLGDTTDELADKAEGIDRIAVLRADVDNLGTAFVSGFRDKSNNDRYVTISRTAALSRQLSIFFKLYINHILKEPAFSLKKKSDKKQPRNATIVYSGGDDLFIIGSWNDVIELAVDIRNSFEKYTEGTLSLSAGIGIYQNKYPISAAAYEVAEYEESSKSLPGKDAITLLVDGAEHMIADSGHKYIVSDGTYRWNSFEQGVCREKLDAITEYFSKTSERGNALLYHLLELIRNQKDRINFARYVYLLARMEPEEGAPMEVKEAYQVFSKQMYQWVQSDKDCRELKTAITIYVYLHRTKEEEQ